jgi:hypothetical protein
MSKTKLTKAEVKALVDAQLLNKLMADNLKEVKSRVKTDELASTVVGEDCKGNVHKPYSCDGVGEIQVIDSVRESLDSKKLAEFVSEDIIKECTRVSEVHTVNIKPDKRYAVEFENRVNKALALLDEVDNLKEEVKAKVMAMIKQQKVVK